MSWPYQDLMQYNLVWSVELGISNRKGHCRIFYANELVSAIRWLSILTPAGFFQTRHHVMNHDAIWIALGLRDRPRYLHADGVLLLQPYRPEVLSSCTTMAFSCTYYTRWIKPACACTPRRASSPRSPSLTLFSNLIIASDVSARADCLKRKQDSVSEISDNTVPFRPIVHITHHKASWTEPNWLSSRITRTCEHPQNWDCRYEKKFRCFAPILWTIWSKNSFSHASPLVVNISASELCASRITRCERSVEMVQYPLSIYFSAIAFR